MMLKVQPVAGQMVTTKAGHEAGHPVLVPYEIQFLVFLGNEQSIGLWSA